MKKINKVLFFVLSFIFVFNAIAPMTVHAATTPSLGLAETFSILSSTFTRNGGITTLAGDLGYTTLSGSGSHTVSGATHVADGTYSTAGTNQGTALTNLNNQACTFTFADGAIDLATDTTHGQIGVYTPGVYCTGAASAASVGTGGITLNGAGTYIFRVNGALTTVNNSAVSLANSASSCDVFWTPTSATTLGANTTFNGTVIDDSGITVGANTTWLGRALAFGGTVTTDTSSISSNCSISSATPSSNIGGSGNNTITVFKQVINDNGGTATYSDFPLFINGNPVVSGQSVSFPSGVYTVTETNLPGYTGTFTGNCDANGVINHGGNAQNNVCIIVNNDIGPAAPVVPPLIDVVKTANPLSLPMGPGIVTYTYTLRNIGTVPVTDVTMIGDTCSPINRISGDTNNDNKLDLNEVWVHTCAKMTFATHTNTVVATGWANGINAVDIASATVIVGAAVVPPIIHITKVPNPLMLQSGPGFVTYTNKVTNPGIVSLGNINVTDDKCGPINYIFGGDINLNTLLDVNETWTYTCRTRLTQTTTNTATVTGTANGLVATDFALATVIVSTPTLPRTGFTPKENNSLWNTIVQNLFYFFY